MSTPVERPDRTPQDGGSESAVLSLATYRNESHYPFCPGCGHGPILDALNQALVRLQVEPRRTVIVSDIGCAGLSDQYFNTNAFHGLHGRSIVYASGIKLARPDLQVIVVMGDGGCGIGGAHLLSAARRNIGITVLVLNNLNFGMTGGQHSVTTPTGSLTTTTPGGNLERPLDVCGTVAVNGAGYVYRATSFDKDLPERMSEAFSHDGFALLDIWELCTAYFAPANRFSKKTLMKTLETLRLTVGLLHREERPEYARAYRGAAAAAGGRSKDIQTIEPRFKSRLDRRFGLVLAGSAGGRVRSATRLAATASVLSRLWAAQRDDYPVTVKTGYSLSELVLSPEPLEYSGLERPDALVLVTPEGLKKAARHLRAMTGQDRVFSVPSLAPLQTRARVTLLDPAGIPSASRALCLLTAALHELQVLPVAALEAAAQADSHAEANLEAIRAGVALAQAV